MTRPNCRIPDIHSQHYWQLEIAPDNCQPCGSSILRICALGDGDDDDDDDTGDDKNDYEDEEDDKVDIGNDGDKDNNESRMTAMMMPWSSMTIMMTKTPRRR